MVFFIRKLFKGTDKVQDDPASFKKVAVVFSSGSTSGHSMVHTLWRLGSEVTAVTESFNDEDAKALEKLDRVNIKVVDTTKRKSLSRAIAGSDRVVLVTKYWEKFEDSHEEEQAMTLIDACKDANVDDLLFSSIEDTKDLRRSGQKSQILPNKEGKIQPTFSGMLAAKTKAKEDGVHLTHMITSYIDTRLSRTSMCLISGENGKLIVSPFFDDDDDDDAHGDNESHSSSSLDSGAKSPRRAEAWVSSKPRSIIPMTVDGPRSSFKKANIALLAVYFLGVAALVGSYHGAMQNLWMEQEPVAAAHDRFDPSIDFFF